MTPEDFNLILDKRLMSIKAVLGNKAKEYAHGGDRLHNFKVAANMLQSTQAKALWGIAVKHFVSVSDLVNGDLESETAMINEKIGDAINYLILLEAVLKEDIDPKVEFTCRWMV